MFLLVHSNTPICVGPSNSSWLLNYVENLLNSHHIIITHHIEQAKNMVKIILVGFLPQENRHNYEVHPNGCVNTLLEKQGNGMGRLVWLRLVERTNLTDYGVGEDGSDGFQVCFAEQEYVSGENGRRLDGSLVRITDVFLPDSGNQSMSALFHRNHGYAYAEIVETN